MLSIKNINKVDGGDSTILCHLINLKLKVNKMDQIGTQKKVFEALERNIY